MRFHSVVVAYTLWLTGIFGVFYLVQGHNETALQLALLAGAIPVACQILLLGVDWHGLVAPVKMWLALLLVILFSYLVNVMDPRTAPSAVEGLAIPAAWTPIVYTLNVVFMLGIATVVAGCPDRRLLQSVAGLFCVLSAPFLIYIDLTGEWSWGRLRANDIESNVWGLMGLTVCVTAFARKLGPLAIAGFVAGAATIFEASSREHMVALLVVLPVVVALYLQAMDRPRLQIVLAGSCVTLVVVAVLVPYMVDAIGYVGSDVLMLDNPQRGVDSGFTGRFDVWAATTDLWLKHPLLGIGFRQHEQFLAGTPAHNAYLAMLADTGLLGLIWYLALLTVSLVASWGIKDLRTRRFAVALIVAYLIVGFFDRRTINGGNPCSLLFIMCCAVALADRSLRKAASVLGGKPEALQHNLAGSFCKHREQLPSA